MSNHLNFRLERIIALDPARPLIRPGNQNRLDTGDARSVQVIHTNAGYYGEGGRIGHIGKKDKFQSIKYAHLVSLFLKISVSTAAEGETRLVSVPSVLSH